MAAEIAGAVGSAVILWNPDITAQRGTGVTSPTRVVPTLGIPTWCVEDRPPGKRKNPSRKPSSGLRSRGGRRSSDVWDRQSHQFRDRTSALCASGLSHGTLSFLSASRREDLRSLVQASGAVFARSALLQSVLLYASSSVARTPRDHIAFRNNAQAPLAFSDPAVSFVDFYHWVSTAAFFVVYALWLHFLKTYLKCPGPLHRCSCTSPQAAAAVDREDGAATIAAHHVAFQSWLLLAFLADSLGTAGQALVARSVGEGDPEGARRTIDRLLQVMGLLTTAIPVFADLSDLNLQSRVRRALRPHSFRL